MVEPKGTGEDKLLPLELKGVKLKLTKGSCGTDSMEVIKKSSY